jgi:hypothetical protein
MFLRFMTIQLDEDKQNIKNVYSETTTVRSKNHVDGCDIHHMTLLKLNEIYILQ